MTKPKVNKIVDNSAAGIYAVSKGKVAATVHVNKYSLAHADDNKSTPQNKNDDSYKIALNGDSNLRPQEIIEKARKLPAIEAALQKRAELFYSAGWHFGKLQYGNDEEQGKESFVPVKNMEIRKWLRRTNWDYYVFNAAKELGWWHMVFVEIIKGKGGKLLAQVIVHKYAHCRFHFNKSLGKYTKCVISPDWEGTEVPSGAKTLTVLDPMFDVVGQLKKSKDTNFILPLFHPSVLENYYPVVPFHNFISSDWYEVAVKIAGMNLSIVQNATISYHIEIAESWFEWKFPGFKDFPASKKDELTTTAISVFLEAISGTDNSGNVFTSVKMLNADQTKEYSLWDVNVIDNKYKDGVHLPTSQEAYQHLYSALGVDRSILGPVPGATGLNNGSGSEKRVANNIQLSSQKFEADLIFKVFDIVREYNDWDEEIIMRIRQESITTLDQGKETQVGDKPESNKLKANQEAS